MKSKGLFKDFCFVCLVAFLFFSFTNSQHSTELANTSLVESANNQLRSDLNSFRRLDKAAPAETSEEDLHHNNSEHSSLLQKLVKRSAPIELETGIFEKGEFSFKPFDEDYLVKAHRVEESSNNIRSMAGRLFNTLGEDIGEVHLSEVIAKDGTYFSGFFHFKDGRNYELGHDSTGEAIVQEIDAASLPGCANDEHNHLSQTNLKLGADTFGGEVAADSAVAAADGNTQIDLLVVYTTNAVSAAGGESALLAKISSAVSAANTAYSNSEVNITLNVVHTEALGSSGTGNFETDLNQLTFHDGQWDNVHTLRDTHAADLVALISADGGYCGIGWVSLPSPAYDILGFSVTSQTCLGSQTLAHELGHNMGSMHNPEAADGYSGAYPYSFGHNFGSYRSVMAYAPGSRLSYFSNPDISYDGFATGTSERNNALSLNNMASIISNFRGGSSTPPAVTFALTGGITVNGNGLSGVSVQSSALGSTNTDSNGTYFFASIPNGQAYTLTPQLSGYVFSPSSVSASISNANSSHNFTASRPPTISSLADQIISEFPSTTSINLSASDPEGDALSFTAEFSTSYSSDPATLSLTGSQLQITPTSGYTGSFDVTVTVSDGIGSSSSSFTVTIEGASGGEGGNGGGSGSGSGGSSGEGASGGGSDSGSGSGGSSGEGSSGSGSSDGSEGSGETGTTDSDNDGVSDSQEVIDGTDPNDRGSFIRNLSSPVYTLWNGFLGMTNILEIVNTNTSDVNVNVTLYTSEGDGTTLTVPVPAVGQFDLVLNNIDGFIENSYGLVKLEFDTPIDGRVSYYRGNASSGFEFSFGIPLSNPNTGESFVSFNTMQPSLSSLDSCFEVANWLSIVNLADTAKSFTVTTHFMDGRSPLVREIVVSPAGRVDVDGGHDLGADSATSVSGCSISPLRHYGVHSIQPEDSDSPYIAQLIRYGGTAEKSQVPTSYRFAFPLIAKAGNGDTMNLSLTTAGNEINWLEVANVSDTATSVTANFYSEDGSLLSSRSIALAPFETYPFDIHSLLPANTNGFAQISGSNTSSLIAQSMVYYIEDSTSRMAAMYGTDGVPSRNTSTYGSYNLYLDMDNILRVTNPSDTTMVLRVAVSSGVGSFEKIYSVAAKSTLAVSLRNESGFQLSADSYGVVVLRTDDNAPYFAELVRQRYSGSDTEFVAPTLIR